MLPRPAGPVRVQYLDGTVALPNVMACLFCCGVRRYGHGEVPPPYPIVRDIT
jgi:hypothetical protein